MAFSRYRPATAALAAAISTGHALFWEVLRAARGDYWSGWTVAEVAGAAAGGMGYFAIFFVLNFVVGTWTSRQRGRLSLRALTPIAGLIAAAIVWGMLFSIWDGARLPVAVLVGGSLVVLLTPLVFGIGSRDGLVLGVAPSFAGISGVLVVASVTKLDPALRQTAALAGLAYFAVAWLVLVAWWAYVHFRNRRVRLAVVSALIVAAPLGATFGSFGGMESPQRSLVLITVDALRADYCSAYGGNVPTPALERLGGSGVVFERAYALGPWTLPSMTGLFGSMYPPSLTPGAERAQWIDEMQYYHVPGEVPMLAELLKAQGYATYALVANKLLDQPDGVLRGFEHSAVFHSSMPARGGLLTQMPFLQEFVGRIWPRLAPVGAVDTTRPLRELARTFVRRHRDEPFFLWVHFMDPHAPWDPPVRFRDADGPWRLVDPSDAQWGGPQFEKDTHILELAPDEQAYVRGLYEGEIRYVDEAIGELLDTLDGSGAADSTVVCVTSDHGEEFWDHGQVTHGQSLFEELVRVPLLVSGQAVATARIDAPVSHLDLMPSLAEALGVAAPEAWCGKSRYAALKDGEIDVDTDDVFAQGTYIVAPEPMRMIVRGRDKVVEGLETRDAAVYDTHDERRPLVARDDMRDAGVDAMEQWWTTFPATMETFRAGTTHVGEDMHERLRSLGYLD